MTETSPELTIRVVDALEASARVSEQVLGQVKGLEREFIALREGNSRDLRDIKETFDRQLGELEDEMRMTNSHLDNLVRETVVTNQLLREDMDDRKTALDNRLKIEQEDREWQRDLEVRKLDRTEKIADDNRNVVLKAADGAWSVLSQPFGYLLAGVIFWLLTTYFAVPPHLAGPPAPSSDVSQVETTKP